MLRKLLSPICFVLGCLLISTAVMLSAHDSYIRKAATEELPGDPPTMFMFGAYAAGIVAVFLLVGAVFSRRKWIS